MTRRASQGDTTSAGSSSGVASSSTAHGITISSAGSAVTASTSPAAVAIAAHTSKDEEDFEFTSEYNSWMAATSPAAASSPSRPKQPQPPAIQQQSTPQSSSTASSSATQSPSRITVRPNTISATIVPPFTPQQDAAVSFDVMFSVLDKWKSFRESHSLDMASVSFGSSSSIGINGDGVSGTRAASIIANQTPSEYYRGVEPATMFHKCLEETEILGPQAQLQAVLDIAKRLSLMMFEVEDAVKGSGAGSGVFSAAPTTVIPQQHILVHQPAAPGSASPSMTTTSFRGMTANIAASWRRSRLHSGGGAAALNLVPQSTNNNNGSSGGASMNINVIVPIPPIPVVSSVQSQALSMVHPLDSYSACSAPPHTPLLIGIGGLDTMMSEQVMGQLVSTALPRTQRAQLVEDGGFEMINEFLIVDELGRGSAGAVYLGMHEITGLPVAIKAMVKAKPQRLLPSERSARNRSMLQLAGRGGDREARDSQQQRGGGGGGTFLDTHTMVRSGSSSSLASLRRPLPSQNRVIDVKAAAVVAATKQSIDAFITESNNDSFHSSTGTITHGGTVVASKQPQHQQQDSNPAPSRKGSIEILPIEREIWIMKHIDHPNVVKLMQVIDDEEEQMIYLVMEYCNGGSISRLLRSDGLPAPPPPPSPIARQLTTGSPGGVVQRVSLSSGTLATGERRDSFGASAPPTALPQTMTLSVPDISDSAPLTTAPPPPPPPSSEQPIHGGVIRPISRLVDFLKQICAGLRYLHRLNIIHRDIKPDNILLADGEVVKITDFGVSGRLFSSRIDLKRQAGTPAYLAPEVIRNADNTCKASDVWSLGVTLYNMMFGYLPFHGVRIHDQVDSILHDDVVFPPLSEVPQAEGLDDVAYATWRDVVRSMLEKNPAKRLTLRQLMHHPFVAGVGYGPREVLRVQHGGSQPAHHHQQTHVQAVATTSQGSLGMIGNSSLGMMPPQSTAGGDYDDNGGGGVRRSSVCSTTSPFISVVSATNLKTLTVSEMANNTAQTPSSSETAMHGSGGWKGRYGFTATTAAQDSGYVYPNNTLVPHEPPGSAAHPTHHAGHHHHRPTMPFVDLSRQEVFTTNPATSSSHAASHRVAAAPPPPQDDNTFASSSSSSSSDASSSATASGSDDGDTDVDGQRAALTPLGAEDATSSDVEDALEDFVSQRAPQRLVFVSEQKRRIVINQVAGLGGAFASFSSSSEQ